MPKKKVKQGVRALAAELGLSVATVSRALNDVPNVKPETRNLVRAAARKVGYIPNPAAKALSTRRTKTIAAVIPTLAHSIFARFMNAVEIELAVGGYGLAIATSDGDLDLELKRAEEMLVLGAEGLIVSGASHREDLYALIGQRGTPTVCTSIYDPNARLPTIGYDNRELARMAVDYLHSLGHRRIAVVHGPTRQNDRTVLRLAGARDAAAGTMEIVPVGATLDVGGGVTAMRELIETGDVPSAILCLSDVLALGVGFELRRRNIAVPDDVSVMGFDDLDWAEHAEPALTTIKLPVVQMGQLTAAALVEHLDNGVEISATCLPAGLIVRSSTAPRRIGG